MRQSMMSPTLTVFGLDSTRQALATESRTGVIEHEHVMDSANLVSAIGSGASRGVPWIPTIFARPGSSVLNAVGPEAAMKHRCSKKFRGEKMLNCEMMHRESHSPSYGITAHAPHG
jgi:hypothetical protein